MPDPYRVATWGPVPRRHEAAVARLPAVERQQLVWAVLVRDSDGAQAEALLPIMHAPTIDLSTIPQARILCQTTGPT
jgi:hypothetical protein